jgi:hypothetical protein
MSLTNSTAETLVSNSKLETTHHILSMDTDSVKHTSRVIHVPEELYNVASKKCAGTDGVPMVARLGD